MEGVDRKHLARQLYEAFSAGDRDFFEKHLANDLVFQSPTEVLTFDGDRVERIEVYFGWNREEEGSA